MAPGIVLEIHILFSNKEVIENTWKITNMSCRKSITCQIKKKFSRTKQETILETVGLVFQETDLQMK